MFSLTQSYRYYLYSGICDMRKSFNGLCGLIVSQMHSDPSNGDAYLFINKRRNQLKILRWESGGFIIYYKRLEEGTFELPHYDADRKTYQMDYPSLLLMLEGISFNSIKKRKRYIRKSI